MKKLVIIASLGVIIVIIATYIAILANNYHKAVTYINDHVRYTGNFAVLYTDFFDKYGEYPISTEEALNDFRNEFGLSHEEALQYSLWWSTDPFDREGQLISYIPLYDRNSGKRESFILLSTGPDGRLNANISPQDTVFADCWWEKLPVYNYFEYALFQDYIQKCTILKAADPNRFHDIPDPDLKTMMKFNPKYYFGDKDYVIQVIGIPVHENY